MSGPTDNEFTIKLANVNGTGSASANSMLMQTLFRMGIPVVGKNYFPSNIQGLPTWYEIRVSARGYLCRSKRLDIMVAMNAETYQKDLGDVAPGGVLLYDSTWPRSRDLYREDITVLGVPLARMCNEHFPTARARILMKNICYVGVLAALLELDTTVIRALLAEKFADKPQLMDANEAAIKLGYGYARAHLPCPLAFTAKPIDATRGHITIDGNSAAALGCLYGGATFGAWYPITPSTSLMDAFTRFCSKYRVDPETGRNNYCIIQAEDELAAIGMVLGASWMGARSFTPTSGPGVSLMNEFVGYGYYAEIPAVIFDVQRVGPSTGMPTRTQQGDIMSCAYASHGDTRHVLLFPADPEESFYMAPQAFDLAEHLQTPVFVLLDLDIGMNDWMVPEFKWDDSYRPNRGKVLDVEALEKLETFHRYTDVDGDGVPYRTLPGEHPKGAYFTRGSGHNLFGGYTEDAREYREVMERLQAKWETARSLVPEPIVEHDPAQRVGIISIGSCDGPVREARDLLAAQDVHVNYLRIRAFPFSRQVEEFIAAHDKIYVVEQNRDAQLRALLINELSIGHERLASILHFNGLPMAAEHIVIPILADMQQGQAA